MDGGGGSSRVESRLTGKSLNSYVLFVDLPHNLVSHDPRWGSQSLRRTGPTSDVNVKTLRRKDCSEVQLPNDYDDQVSGVKLLGTVYNHKGYY